MSDSGLHTHVHTHASLHTCKHAHIHTHIGKQINIKFSLCRYHDNQDTEWLGHPKELPFKTSILKFWNS